MTQQRPPSFADLDGPDESELLSLEELDADAAPNPVDMVIFGVGDVLYRWNPFVAVSEGVGSELAHAFLDDASVDFPRRVREANAGRPWSEVVEDIIAECPRYRSAAESLPENLPKAVAEPLSDTVEILKELHAAEVPLFAVTNCARELFGMAEAQHDFLDLFEEVVISGEEGVLKPDPEIWEILEEVTRHAGGLSDAIFIDDSADNVMGAEQAGIDSICFTDAGSLREELRLRGLPLKAAH